MPVLLSSIFDGGELLGLELSCGRVYDRRERRWRVGKLLFRSNRASWHRLPLDGKRMVQQWNDKLCAAGKYGGEELHKRLGVRMQRQRRRKRLEKRGRRRGTPRPSLQIARLPIMD